MVRVAPIALGLVAGVLGCARSPPPTVQPDPPEPAAAPADEMPAPADPEPGQAEAPIAEEALADPEAEHISFDGPDAEPAPADQVVAPPTRPPMPSMMTDVLKTGPRPR